jgi:ABC-2 type transport system ATP-binding protein
MAPIIEIRDLTRQYNGRTAVDRLNLAIEEGEIFGFVGPNGAGKTSTIRMMATLLRPNAGDIRIAGHSVITAPRQVRQVIGYMPDIFGVYPGMKVWEYLDFFAACYALPEAGRPRLIAELLELVDLLHRREDPVESLSRGMQQRLSLARTLVHDPQVLILDEPASGLDPRARVEIRELLVELARLGKTVFFSTHILADVAEISTSVGILEAGQLVASGRLEDLHLNLMPHRLIVITLLGRSDEAIELLKGLDSVARIAAQSLPGSEERSRLEIDFTGDDRAVSALLASLVERGLPVIHFNAENRDLEEVFLRATRGLVT